MRAVVFGLIASVLALGSAQAAECRAGHMAFVDGDKRFDVTATAHAKRAIEGRKAERSLFRGQMDGKPFIVDVTGVQGSSTSFDSYAGQEAETTGLSAKWGTASSALSDGAPITIYSGPLKGDWQTVCH